MFFTILTTTVFILLTIIQILMLVRAVLSWIPSVAGSPFENLVLVLTEPVIYPFRRLFEKFRFSTSLPLDIPFFCAFLVVSILRALLFS